MNEKEIERQVKEKTGETVVVSFAGRTNKKDQTGGKYFEVRFTWRGTDLISQFDGLPSGAEIRAAVKEISRIAAGGKLHS